MTAPDVVTEMFAAYRTSLDSLEGKLGNAFSDAVDLLEGMSGTVVVCGMGKSGLICPYRRPLLYRSSLREGQRHQKKRFQVCLQDCPKTSYKQRTFQ